MTPQNKKLLGTAALCVGGAALLLHPAILFTFGAGVWAGRRGGNWLRGLLADREAWL